MPSLVVADLAQVPIADCSVSADAKATAAHSSALPINPSQDARARIQASMGRYADGHRDAFDPLFQLLWPLVREFTRRALHNQADADDAAQNALLKVFARISTYDPQRDALGWALGIAYYEVLTLRKKTQRLREDGAQALVTLATGTPTAAEDALLARELSEAMRVALAELPEGDRELMTALVCEAAPGSGTDATDVAVRKRRQRAKERLREVWRRLYGSF
jgi:RNA polymerase sigma factor (sigma-70 family)